MKKYIDPRMLPIAYLTPEGDLLLDDEMMDYYATHAFEREEIITLDRWDSERNIFLITGERGGRLPDKQDDPKGLREKLREAIRQAINAPPPLFKPSTPPNLWLDAADLTSLIVDGSGKVQRWEDKSGTGGHATQEDEDDPDDDEYEDEPDDGPTDDEIEDMQIEAQIEAQEDAAREQAGDPYALGFEIVNAEDAAAMEDLITGERRALVDAATANAPDGEDLEEWQRDSLDEEGRWIGPLMMADLEDDTVDLCIPGVKLEDNQMAIGLDWYGNNPAFQALLYDNDSEEGEPAVAVRYDANGKVVEVFLRDPMHIRLVSDEMYRNLHTIPIRPHSPWQEARDAEPLDPEKTIL